VVSEPGLVTISQAAQYLRDGEIIAYPTEAVYGLGCNPENENAVLRLLAMKSRPAAAGLILIADRFDRLESYTRPVSDPLMERAMSTWPGPVTWLFPSADNTPGWLTGVHQTIALRVTAHPVCRALCAEFQGAIVSTSANPSGSEAARSGADVLDYFGPGVCGIVEGALGGEESPSEIRNLENGLVVRAG
jgi:L-threonylcarbamoyladenylate synthase